MKRGILYGLGMGPGAPDLITLRAARILGSVDAVLAAAASSKEYSRSLKIARPHLRPNTEIIRLDFPMTRDPAQTQAAWDKAARTTLAILDTGKNAAFLTLGDPLIYSTFGYLMKRLLALAPDCQTEIVSGVTSFQAAAAITKTILCEGSESLTVIPGILRQDMLVELLEHCDTAAILKVFRNHKAIRQALIQTGRAENCLLASDVETEAEQFDQLSESRPPYMSLILSKNLDRERNYKIRIRIERQLPQSQWDYSQGH